jgi:hypothetical protein
MLEALFGAEMPLAQRFALFFLIVLLLTGAIGALIWAVRSGLRKPVSPPLPTVRLRQPGEASKVFQILFWIHQLVLGLPSVGIGLDLLGEGKATGIINAIGLLLAWIGGTLVWGLAAIIHQRPVYELPPILAAINENIARLEKMHEHESAVKAVADELSIPSATPPQTQPSTLR